jgi:hypothetical protein
MSWVEKMGYGAKAKAAGSTVDGQTVSEHTGGPKTFPFSKVTFMRLGSANQIEAAKEETSAVEIVSHYANEVNNPFGGTDETNKVEIIHYELGA